MLENIDRYVGLQIQAAREHNNLMQSELADVLQKAGVNWSRATLSKVERGERQVRLSETPIVARTLGLSLSELLPGGSSLDSTRIRVEWGYQKALDDVNWAKSRMTWASNALKSLRLIEALAAGDTQRFRVSIGLIGFFSGFKMVEIPLHMRVDQVLTATGISLEEIDQAKKDAARALGVWVNGGELPEWFENMSSHIERNHPWFKTEFEQQRLMNLFSEKFPNVEFAQTPNYGDEFESEPFDIEAEEHELVIDGLAHFDLPDSFQELIKKADQDDGDD